MSKWIKLEDAINDLDDLLDYLFADDIKTPTALKQVKADLLNLPTIEIRERTGEWIDRCREHEDYECSECGGVTEKLGGQYLYDYCPFCGAKMSDDE